MSRRVRAAIALIGSTALVGVVLLAAVSGPGQPTHAPTGPGGLEGSAAPASAPGAGSADPGRLTMPPVGPAASGLAGYRSPALAGPLPDLDPGLASRGLRPTLAQLASNYQYGNPAVMRSRVADESDWRIARPDLRAVRGYADAISVLPGQSLGIALAGTDPWADLDVFQIGRGDAARVAHLSNVRIPRAVDAQPSPAHGLVEDAWPLATRLPIGADWSSGLYLIKLTGASGGESYILFVVRAPASAPLLVVLPTLTYEAYNDQGGADLYGWYRGPRRRAYSVSFDRPFASQFGAGLFFRLDFPLIVWLEDHGYAPGYVADVDLARDPSMLQGVQTLVFSGHSEYWTGGMRDAVEGAARAGTNLAFLGANQAFWQVRLAPDAAGNSDRRVVSYKSAALDPLTASDPAGATGRFEDPPVNRPPSRLVGVKYGGIIGALYPLSVGPRIADFAPDTGLRPGQQLPGLVGEEVDELHHGFRGLALGQSPVPVREHPGLVLAGTTVRLSPLGDRVFNAGTFDYSWGLDPRYSAALPDFDANAFSELTARVLAWLGAVPG
jgi:hypothetical protein